MQSNNFVTPSKRPRLQMSHPYNYSNPSSSINNHGNFISPPPPAPAPPSYHEHMSSMQYPHYPQPQQQQYPQQQYYQQPPLLPPPQQQQLQHQPRQLRSQASWLTSEKMKEYMKEELNLECKMQLFFPQAFVKSYGNEKR